MSERTIDLARKLRRWSAERWETMGHYMQDGPGVFMGDLHYYFTDGDLRNGLAEPPRQSACPLYLLSGE